MAGADVPKAGDFDDALKSLGEMGRFQFIMFLLVCVPASFLSMVALFGHLFVSAVPNHHCALPLLPRSVSDSLNASLSTPEVRTDLYVLP